ncbi:uncharacterized protein LOC132293478 [Cornus florida]|uniref:uncharacterized protein LOC132293478 n=1 Tax=Cornus florida TaxID=4283 RepID=UPI002897E0EB|nr:uncharacterized protein LOC132293478 [Cornus florida]XP_059646979.1 uncharacterized protein LOC132293478 [Cornus florida]XP_059646987.1 uncharacterized protein LOC132293478 [Cornus florida]XP_059646995.1 uncharacterized protein LOC132293478 [Cornus florida]
MGVEKQGSKSGVGGFFQLFDWNAKSRKKLFSSKTDLPEQSKQKKRTDGNFPTTRLHLMDEDEIVARSSIKGSSDYSCASSVTDEEGCGNRGPGVVARLMGLDSLPMSNFVEPYSSPFFDSQSLRDAHFHRRNLDFQHDNQIMHSSILRNNVEAPFRDAMDPKPPQKMINRPIEKFQTEILPPKSAKSVPVTHHKLLSPIKSSGFIPSKNAAQIMEAAAKIIEPGPHATTKAKRPLVSSSVPLKVRDFKEKVEAAQKLSRLAETSRRPIESNAAKYLKGQSMNNSWNGSVGTTSSKGSSYSENCNTGLNNKGKSISLALQAKVNVQKRESLNASRSGSLFGEKEQSEIMSSQPFKSQPNIQKSAHKKPSTHVASTVLKQNNQKQNCMMDREKLPSKPMVSSSRSRKSPSGDSSVGRHKSSSKILGNSKVGSRLGSIAADYKKEVPYSGTKNVSRKKRSIDGNFHFEKNQEVDNMLICKNGKPNESNSLIDGHFSWAEDSNRKGMDVVSFTFTAPMTRLTPGFETSRQVKEKNDGFSADYRGEKVLHNSDSTNRTKLSLGGDALSILLEQKLRELTHAVESSSSKAETAGSSSSIFQDMVPAFKAVNSTSMLYDERSQEGMHADKLGCQYGPDFFSTAPQRLITKNKLQGMEEMDECSSNYAESRKLLDYRHPSPISVLEPSSLSESCNSTDSTDSNSTEGIKQCSSVQAQEVLGMGSSKKIYLVEADAELSDSASSRSGRAVARMHITTTLSVTDSVGSTSWELKYVKEILCNVELMFKDFALGRTSEIINPHLFDQLETRKGVSESHGDKPKLKPKLLFDCVSECIDLRCRRYADGGCRTWAKGLSVVRRKERLAEEIYKEISGWSDMADFMVDELADKDMSTQYGKWLDFEVEEFELGVEIEKRILNSLVDEMIADLLPL